MNLKNIAVFCGSNFGVSPIFRDEAHRLGAGLGKNGYNVIYGGGQRGLMGVMSNAAHENGAHVTGILLGLFMELSGDLPERYAEHMAENVIARKARMIDMADAGVIFPGSYGTLCELAAIIETQEMQIYGTDDPAIQPIIVINLNGYYDGFKAQMETFIDNGFLKETRRNLVTFVDDADGAIAALNDMREKPQKHARDFR